MGREIGISAFIETEQKTIQLTTSGEVIGVSLVFVVLYFLFVDAREVYLAIIGCNKERE